MEIWKFMLVASVLLAIVRCDENDSVNVAENEVEPLSNEESLIRQKKSHPSTTCIPGINNGPCNSGDDMYSVGSSSNYYGPVVQPGYGPQTSTSQNQRQTYGAQYSQFPASYGQPQPSPYGAGPAHYAPQGYKPPSYSGFGSSAPSKPTYGIPPSSQAVPPRTVYGPPPQTLYRTFDQMDHMHMHRPDIMEEVGSFHHRPIAQPCAPFHAAAAPFAPAPCSQQFTVSCTPQIYSSSKTPSYQPVYYTAPPEYAPPLKPSYSSSPIVYAPEPHTMYQMQQHPNQVPPSSNKMHTYRTNDNMMPNTMQQSNGPISSAGSDQQQMMDKNPSIPPSMRNESPNQQQTQPKANSNDERAPTKITPMLKLAEQIKDNEKKSGMNAMSTAYGWE